MTTVLSRVGQTLEHSNLGPILTQPSAGMNILLKKLQEEDLYILQELIEIQKALQRQDHPVRVTQSTHESAPQLGDLHTHLEVHQLGDLPLPLKLIHFEGQHILQALKRQDHPVSVTRSIHERALQLGDPHTHLEEHQQGDLAILLTFMEVTDPLILQEGHQPGDRVHSEDQHALGRDQLQNGDPYTHIGPGYLHSLLIIHQLTVSQMTRVMTHRSGDCVTILPEAILYGKNHHTHQRKLQIPVQTRRSWPRERINTKGFC